ncbi:hypothetical protein DYB32_003695 [Aphanomyces invadans]|uniref:Major facilitator superfamily associated domain-containing protein n=1 Tax=Aphanomyces invadans TaxID=157072 RepID=A0A418AZX4_9STRA|nr:hypothetical protein DYB32_003695 [Aphanomyces invadans]
MAQPKPTRIWLLEEKDMAQLQQTPDMDVMTMTHRSQDYCVIMDKRQTTESINSDGDDNDWPKFGALRPGGALNLLSWEAFGLLSQYAGVGILMGVLGALQYPVFHSYLRMEGYQTASYGVLISLGWSSKIFFGILSDCCPLFGYQRRPYMIIGWMICATCCLVMAITPFPDPYYGKKEVFRVPLSKIPAEDLKYINLDAPKRGGFFIVLSMMCSLGYVLAVVAADAMVVQYAQREPAAIRGRTQTAIYFTRDAFSMVPILVVGFCMNDYKYGGTFSWSIGPNIVYAALTVPCLLAAYSAYALLVEEKVTKSPFRAYLSNAWMLLQQRVVWQICMFKFLNMLFYAYYSTLNDPVWSFWIQVEPIVSTAFSIVYQLFKVGAMFGIGKYALNWDWRWAMAASTLAIVAVDTTLNFLAVWNVVRDQYFQNILGSLAAIPQAAIFLFSGYLVVEIADVGNEGLVFALVTTCSNLAIPLSTVLAKTVDSFFTARLTDIQRDDTAVRWEVTYSYIATAAMKLLSLVFLALMPRQKAYIQVLKRTGSLSPVAAAIVFVVFVFGYTWNVTTNILSIFPSTSCLRIAGGRGC